MGDEIGYKLIKDSKDFEAGTLDNVEGVFGKTVKEEFWSNNEFIGLEEYGANTKKNILNDLKNYKETLKRLDSKSYIKKLLELKEDTEFLAKVNVADSNNIKSGFIEQITIIHKRIKELDAVNKTISDVVKKYKLKKTDNMVG